MEKALNNHSLAKARALYDESLRASTQQERERLLNLALEAFPDHVDAIVDLGLCRYGQSQYQKARELMSRAVDLQPRSSRILAYLALATGRIDSEDGERLFLRAIALQEDHREFAHLLYGKFLWLHGRRTEAIEECKKALAIDSSFVPALRNLADLLSWFDRDKEADELYRQALRAAPDNRLTHYRYGRFLAQFRETAEQARKYLRRASEQGVEAAAEEMRQLEEEDWTDC